MANEENRKNRECKKLSGDRLYENEQIRHIESSTKKSERTRKNLPPMNMYLYAFVERIQSPLYFNSNQLNEII